MERIGVGLVGFGTVGGSFYRLMRANGGHLSDKSGVEVRIAAVADVDVEKVRREAPDVRVVGDYRKVVEDPEISVVVELVGGTGVAHEIIASALGQGKHVITANKALLALKGQELFAQAKARKVGLKFEAAVCGAIPIIKIVRESLLANRVQRIMGIVNGTSNYILTAMTERGIGFQEALEDAQRKGFAEADPTLDVGGGDSAHKISLLASFAFGGWVDYRQLLCEGITTITPGEIEFAASAGFVFKLVASAAMDQGEVAVNVFPALLPREHPLAAVRNEINAVFVESDYMGPGLFVGKGAGGDPTASSVAADLADLVQSIRLGAEPAGAGFDASRTLALRPRDRLRHRLFFHFVTENRPGIWATVTGGLADNDINIESVHQKWEDRTRPSDLYILVDEAEERQAAAALQRIRSAAGIHPESRYYRVLPV
jgi:homoserine dehydrogenase